MQSLRLQHLQILEHGDPHVAVGCVRFGLAKVHSVHDHVAVGKEPGLAVVGIRGKPAIEQPVVLNDDLHVLSIRTEPVPTTKRIRKGLHIGRFPQNSGQVGDVHRHHGKHHKRQPQQMDHGTNRGDGSAVTPLEKTQDSVVD